MRNVKKWLSDFDNLEPGQQLEVAQAIIFNLRQYESMSDLTEYDKEKSELVRDLFDNVRYAAKEDKEIQKFTSLLDKYDGLSKKNKLLLARDVIGIMQEYYDKDVQEGKESVCSSLGHVFGKWKYNERREVGTSTDPRFLATHPTGKYDVLCYNWSRRCNCCGYVETVKIEPEEARIEREEKEKRAELTTLKRRLRELEKK